MKYYTITSISLRCDNRPMTGFFSYTYFLMAVWRIDAEEMILDAASFIDTPTHARVDDDDDLLPF